MSQFQHSTLDIISPLLNYHFGALPRAGSTQSTWRLNVRFEDSCVHQMVITFHSPVRAVMSLIPFIHFQIPSLISYVGERYRMKDYPQNPSLHVSHGAPLSGTYKLTSPHSFNGPYRTYFLPELRSSLFSSLRCLLSPPHSVK